MFKKNQNSSNFKKFGLKKSTEGTTNISSGNGIGFKFTSTKPTSFNNISKNRVNLGEEVVDKSDKDKTQLITEFDPNAKDPSEIPVKRVIPCIEEEGGWKSRKKSSYIPKSQPIGKDAITSQVINGVDSNTQYGLRVMKPKQVEEVEETVDETEVPESSTKDTQPKEPLTLEQQAIKELMNDATNTKEVKVMTIPLQPYNETDAYRQDVETRPESCTLQDYEETPIEEFGLAMLRGMGWDEEAEEKKKAKQKNKDKEKELVPQPREKLLGLGAKPQPKPVFKGKGSYQKPPSRR
ncbi:hypothetical protein CONCODRAFT_80755, partial [Conidiobolus coronatus NRRL 28638]